MIIRLALAFFFLQVTPEVRQHVEAGIAAKNSGDLRTAAQEFQKVADLMPELAAAHANLGAVLFEQKDYSRAIPSLRKALHLNPDLPGTRVMLGAALLAQGYASEAIPYLQGDDLLGIALLETGQEREAVDKFEAALAKRPDDPDLLYYLSLAHNALARTLYEKLTTEHPESARTQQLLGEANAAAGKRAEAEKHFQAALAARADLRGVHMALGDLFRAGGDLANAEKQYRAEAEMAPGAAIPAYKLGAILLEQGATKAAEAELFRADKLKPDMPETLLALAKAQASLGETATAEKLLRRVIEASPSLAADAHFQLAQIYRKNGHPEQAREEMKMFERLRKSGSENSPSRN